MSAKTAPKKTRIGSVSVRYLGGSPDNNIGPIEQALLKLFMAKDAAKQRDDIIHGQPSWEQIYHLSPQRGAVVSWYNFGVGASVLEIGAECGALSEELVKKAVELTVVEPVEKRALINAHRNHEAANLNIIVGDLHDLPAPETYDYIVCANLLEGTKSFFKADESVDYASFFSALRSRLKPSGRLLVAVGNRFGLKYLAGARDDATGNFFDGLNRSPGKPAVSFGKTELEHLLRENYKTVDFYYPYPDHRRPSIVYSDRYYPGSGAEFPLNSLPSPVPGQTRVHLFSEALSMLSIEQNNLFRELSNSFIVVAGL